MPNKTNTDLDLLIKIANGDNSAIQQVKSLHELQMQNTIRRIIEKSGLHKKIKQPRCIRSDDFVPELPNESTIISKRRRCPAKHQPQFRRAGPSVLGSKSSTQRAACRLRMRSPTILGCPASLPMWAQGQASNRSPPR